MCTNLSLYKLSQVILKKVIPHVTVLYERIIIPVNVRFLSYFGAMLIRKSIVVLLYPIWKVGRILFMTLFWWLIILMSFSTNFVDDVSGVPFLQKLPSVSETLSGLVFTPTHCMLCVINIMPSSTGLANGLSYMYLKKGGVFLASRLCDLFINLSLSNSRIPNINCNIKYN